MRPASIQVSCPIYGIGPVERLGTSFGKKKLFKKLKDLIQSCQNCFKVLFPSFYCLRPQSKNVHFKVRTEEVWRQKQPHCQLCHNHGLPLFNHPFLLGVVFICLSVVPMFICIMSVCMYLSGMLIFCLFVCLIAECSLKW